MLYKTPGEKTRSFRAWYNKPNSTTAYHVMIIGGATSTYNGRKNSARDSGGSGSSHRCSLWARNVLEEAQERERRLRGTEKDWEVAGGRFK